MGGVEQEIVVRRRREEADSGRGVGREAEVQEELVRLDLGAGREEGCWSRGEEERMVIVGKKRSLGQCRRGGDSSGLHFYGSSFGGIRGLARPELLADDAGERVGLEVLRHVARGTRSATPGLRSVFSSVSEFRKTVSQ